MEGNFHTSFQLTHKNLSYCAFHEFQETSFAYVDYRSEPELRILTIGVISLSDVLELLI